MRNYFYFYIIIQIPQIFLLYINIDFSISIIRKYIIINFYVQISTNSILNLISFF